MSFSSLSCRICFSTALTDRLSRSATSRCVHRFHSGKTFSITATESEYSTQVSTDKFVLLSEIECQKFGASLRTIAASHKPRGPARCLARPAPARNCGSPAKARLESDAYEPVHQRCAIVISFLVSRMSWRNSSRSCVHISASHQSVTARLSVLIRRFPR